MRVHIAVPCIGHVYTQAFQAITVASMRGLHWLKVAHGNTATLAFTVTHRRPIIDARNDLSRTAMDAKADYVLWLDDDMIPPFDILEQLMSYEKDMVCGFCCLKTASEEPMIYRYFDEKFHALKASPDWNGLYKVDGTGFACVLMKTDVIRAVHKATDGKPFQFGPNNDFGTEDLYFYKVAKELGYELWCDSNCVVGHLGMKEYRPGMHSKANAELKFNRELPVVSEQDSSPA